MQRNTLPNPLNQRIKGVFVLKEGESFCAQALKLMDTLNCEVLNHNHNRLMIKTTRANLQSIKSCWLSNDTTSTLSQQLNACVTHIIIGR